MRNLQSVLKEHGFNAYAPYTGGSFDLATGMMITEGNKEKKELLSISVTEAYTTDLLQQESA